MTVDIFHTRQPEKATLVAGLQRETRVLPGVKVFVPCPGSPRSPERIAKTATVKVGAEGEGGAVISMTIWGRADSAVGIGGCGRVRKRVVRK
jgi:hypothetical protein